MRIIELYIRVVEGIDSLKRMPRWVWLVLGKCEACFGFWALVLCPLHISTDSLKRMPRWVWLVLGKCEACFGFWALVLCPLHMKN